MPVSPSGMTLNLVAGESYFGARMRLLPFILAYVLHSPKTLAREYSVLVDILGQDADLMDYREKNL